MTPAERRRRFTAEIRRQVRARGVAVDGGVLRLLGTLAELQAGLRDTLAGQPSSFDRERLPALLADLDHQVARWAGKAGGVMGEILEAAWERGPALVEGPLRAAGMHVGGVLLPGSLLDELKDYSADRIKSVGVLARQRIERHVQLGVLGGQSMHEVMVGIGREVDGPGPLRRVSFRAETIARTEVGRVHSAAADRRLVAASKVIPGLGKQWWWSGKLRVLHRSIHHQVRAAEEDFDLPDGVKMKYPRAGGAPVEHVANCGCESVPWKADWK